MKIDDFNSLIFVLNDKELAGIVLIWKKKMTTSSKWMD